MLVNPTLNATLEVSSTVRTLSAGVVFGVTMDRPSLARSRSLSAGVQFGVTVTPTTSGETDPPIIQGLSLSNLLLTVTAQEDLSPPLDFFLGTHDRGAAPVDPEVVEAGTGAYDTATFLNQAVGSNTGLSWTLNNTPVGDRTIAVIAKDNVGNRSAVSTLDFNVPSTTSLIDLDTPSEWTLNSNTLSGGVLTFTSSSLLVSRDTAGILTDGMSYTVSFDLNRTSGSGTVKVNMGGNQSADYSSGSVSFNLTEGTVRDAFRIVPSNFEGTVQNLSVVAA